MAFENIKRNIDRIFSLYPFTPAANQPLQQSTINVADGATAPNIPKGVGEILVQALTQNIRYTLVPDEIPTNTNGFQLIAGNDPIAIPIVGGRTAPSFAAEADGAVLVMQFGK